MTLRPYQQEARYQINTLLNACRHPVFVAPTGTGKTKTAIAVIQDRIAIGQRVFVLTPQEEIFAQWRIACLDARIECGMIDSNGIIGRNKKIYICMPLSLNNILSLLPEHFKPDIIITDECHHSRANTWENIYNFFPNAIRFGLTATPQRTDGKGLDDHYTDIVQTIDMQTAINEGYLAEPLIIAPEQYKINCRIQNGDYNTQDQAEQLGKTRIIGDVIQQYSNIFSGLPILAACSTHEHALQMTKAFCETGYKFEHIHSNLPQSERHRILKEIRTGKINGLCTVGIGIEGLDIPGLYGLIWLRRTLSITIYLQFIGRVLRPMQGKSYGIIIDPVGNTFIHGYPQMQRSWKLTGRDDIETDQGMLAPRMKICPQCSVINAKVNKICHICGYDFTSGLLSATMKRKLPAMVDGKLVILNDAELASRKEEIKIKLAEQRKRHNENEQQQKEMPIKKISQNEKMNILKNGLEQKSGMFAEAIKNYL